MLNITSLTICSGARRRVTSQKRFLLARHCCQRNILEDTSFPSWLKFFRISQLIASCTLGRKPRDPGSILGRRKPTTFPYLMIRKMFPAESPVESVKINKRDHYLVSGRRWRRSETSLTFSPCDTRWATNWLSSLPCYFFNFPNWHFGEII